MRWKKQKQWLLVLGTVVPLQVMTKDDVRKKKLNKNMIFFV